MNQTEHPVIAWWSGGITSAVACRLAIEKYSNVRLIYIHIDSHHPDTLRFKADCEKWYGQEIEQWQSEKYKDQFSTLKGYINGPNGAPCTGKLKKDVRKLVEKEPFSHQVWGFEYTLHEVNRSIRMQEQYPDTYPLFPLIDAKLNKQECAWLLAKEGIDIPDMYKLGYQNNNCIGCVKGGKAYWNKIRVDFPEVFNRMAETEERIGSSCINGTPLSELDPTHGRNEQPIIPECGLFCQLEMEHIISPKAKEIFTQ